MPITSSPARASGRTATPPAAPRPTTTTSVFLRLTAIAASLVLEHGIGIGRNPEDARLLHLLFGSAHGHPEARIAYQTPSDEVRVPAVIGIAERALDGVGAQET